MKYLRRRPLASVAGLAIVVAAVAGTAIAATTGSGGSITAVKVVREPAEQLTTSQSWVNLPGGSTTITVPSGQGAVILARFSAESSCTNDADPDGWPCRVRILIGGVEGAPASGNDFAFDEAACCQGDVDGRESHSMDRSRAGLTAGTYTVQVQWKTTGGSLFTLDDWSLTVERARA